MVRGDEHSNSDTEGGTLVAGVEYSFALHMDQPRAAAVAAKRKRVHTAPRIPRAR